MLTKSEAYYLLFDDPVALGHLLGFTKLEELHNEWIKSMVIGEDDETLQAHRGSYKTTCVSLALAIITVSFPNDNTLFLRKTDTDVKEIVAQAKKMLRSQYFNAIVHAIYGIDIALLKDSATEITTNLAVNNPKGTSQIVAMGIGSSITGKHFDRIFTDDIVNKDDRTSRADREKTKTAYYELQNIKNRGGRIFNTGTPWHKDDAFSIMPPAKVYDCYTTGLMTDEQIEDLKSKMEGSLFAANYEMRHIASDDILFDNPNVNYDANLAEQGESHIDASYGGSDGTAFTICKYRNGNYYVLGKLRHKHVDDCLDEFITLHNKFNTGRMHNEDNGDKGYLNKELKNRGIRTRKYHENTNKYVKISSILKPVWRNIYFVEGTDEEYINQVCDYNENAEHDDAPDSLASIVRSIKKGSSEDSSSLMFL